MVSVAAVFGALAVAWVSWVWISSVFFSFRLKPPPPNTCGSPGGPPVTSPRIRLRDGRHLAYKESGFVPRQRARHHVIVVHGLGGSKDGAFPPLSPELADELGVCMLSYDRAGYGESDPNPGRTGKDEALDVQDLADALVGIGERFYLLGVSMGGYVAWACIKHIPHRLTGVALVAPAVSFWWPSFPRAVADSGFRKLTLRDRLTFSIARHFPCLLYAWMTQRLVTPSAAANPVNGMLNPAVMSRSDAELATYLMQLRGGVDRSGNDNDDDSKAANNNRATQQGKWESVHRDLLMLFADRGVDPMEMGLQDPLQLAATDVHTTTTDADPSVSAGGVQVWQGDEDRIVPANMQRYVAAKLPWVRYREFPELGHAFFAQPGWPDRIVKALLVGRD